jgi:membrane protein YdbS with pleckstrin-like domain
VQKLDDRVVWLWRLQSLARFPFSWLPMAALGAAGLGTVAGFGPGMAVGAGVLTLGFVLVMSWPMLTYEFYGFDIREQDLLVQSGVIFRRRSSIPHSRIQHVETRQGPLERLLGLSRVLVYTASGITADGAIPGLATAQAEAIRDELSRRGGDDGV